MQLFLRPIRRGTSATQDGGRDVAKVTKTVGLYQKVSAYLGSRKVRVMTGYDPEDAGKALGKPRGFSLQDVGASTPLIELICLPLLVFYVCPAIVLVKV